MSVDIDQLPIPDWGLHCPECNYALVGLPSHRCPECGIEFRMQDIVQPWDRLREPWFTGHELPLPDWGLYCPECDSNLYGIEAYECSACRSALAPPIDLLPERDWFRLTKDLRGSLSNSFCETLLQAHDIPHRRDRPPVYIHRTEVESELLATREFYFDVRYVLTNELKLMAEGRQLAAGPPLICPTCNAESPGNFTLCWKCGHAIVDSTDSHAPPT